MSTPGMPDPDDVLGRQQDSEVDPEGADPREPITETSEDQMQEINPDLPDPR